MVFVRQYLFICFLDLQFIFHLGVFWLLINVSCNQDGHQGDLPNAFLRGLSSARLPGRAQIVYDDISKSSNTNTGELVYYLDGAHSPESMDACARWFSKTVSGHQTSASMSSLKSLHEDGLGDVKQNGFSIGEKGHNITEAKQVQKCCKYSNFYLRCTSILYRSCLQKEDPFSL